jgi:predicted ATPase with chaperone activity
MRVNSEDWSRVRSAERTGPAALSRTCAVSTCDRSFRQFVILVVAWTLAELAGRASPGRDEVEVALSFRQPGACR